VDIDAVSELVAGMNYLDLADIALVVVLGVAAV